MSVRVEKDGPVTTVIISRPEARNAVNHETARALLGAFTAFEGEQSAKVAVLYGEGGTFCAGYDLKEAAQDFGEKIYEPEGMGPMGPTRLFLSKPVIAAVEGYAVAGGLELALWCDLRVISEEAVFGVFCRRWGVPLLDGGTVRLPRLIGQSRALDMILTGRPVSAQEALRFGLANRIVPPGKTRKEAESLAQEVAQFPEICMQTDRASAHLQWDFDLPEALKYEGRKGLKPLLEESRKGAARFAAGKGRGGSFENI